MIVFSALPGVGPLPCPVSLPDGEPSFRVAAPFPEPAPVLADAPFASACACPSPAAIGSSEA